MQIGDTSPVHLPTADDSTAGDSESQSPWPVMHSEGRTTLDLVLVVGASNDQGLWYPVAFKAQAPMVSGEDFCDKKLDIGLCDMLFLWVADSLLLHAFLATLRNACFPAILW